MKKISATHDVIVIPTYNERDTIAPLVREIHTLLPDIFILVVDDNSPDKTHEVVEELKRDIPTLELLLRKSKTGLGDAYKEALKLLAGQETVRYIITMDADGSHQPEAIPKLLTAMDKGDVAIGSRYMSHTDAGVIDWNLWRRMLSRVGNIYSRLLTSVPVHDLTAGFICMKREIINRIDLNSISSSGYAYQIEFKTAAYRKAKATFVEVPILFYPRRAGNSKITWRIIFEGIWTPLKLFYQ